MKPLSKSKIIAFRQCPKRLWLEVHKPELREDSAEAQTKFEIGYQVGDAAKRIYDPAGKAAVIDIESEGFEGALERSAILLKELQQPIFEAGFKTKGALAFADVMLPMVENNQTAWKMVEVKSSTSIKDYHRDDIAVQSFVAMSAGVKLKSVSLAHIDNSWVYPGNEDYRGLLVENDLTQETFARFGEVQGWINDAQQVVALPTEPGTAVGEHCFDPFECGFCAYCSRNIKQPEYPVNWLPRFSSKTRAQLADQGIDDLREVSDTLLNDRQAMVKEYTLANKVFFDATGAASDLAGYGFPAYFLDFESIQFPVPIWKGTRPYQQLVFQFSLHILAESGQLTHAEFLDLSGNDPSEPFAKALISACGETGPVFVYNAAFEATRIRELAMRFPDLSRSLQCILDRIVDLLPIARNRYYHPSQQGSWSIKVVLPAIAPDLSYENLEGVKEGDAAMKAFCEAIHPNTNERRKSELEKQLLAYCSLDTFAMVRLWNFFSGRNRA